MHREGTRMEGPTEPRFVLVVLNGAFARHTQLLNIWNVAILDRNMLWMYSLYLISKN